MRPSFHPELVNGPGGDPALYVDFHGERRGLLFDLGDLRALAPRKILRLSDVLVSHAHMDHCFGLDWLVRVGLGWRLRVRLYGPAGFVDQVGHRLTGYTWNLVEHYADDFTLEVTELHAKGEARRAEFHVRTGFAREAEATFRVHDGVLREEAGLRLRAAVLDHRTPCLAFALEQRRHVNIWKSRLDALGLEVGPWLDELKRLVLADAPDDTLLTVNARAGTRERAGTAYRPASATHGEDSLVGSENPFVGSENPGVGGENPDARDKNPGSGGENPTAGRRLPLGVLRQAVRVVPGQKIAYVTDVCYRPDNAARIVALAGGADLLYIEAGFAGEHAAQAAQKCHLTAGQAGELARRAGVRAVEPFHFSPRYQGREGVLRRELAEAFAGGVREPSERDPADPGADPASPPGDGVT